MTCVYVLHKIINICSKRMALSGLVLFPQFCYFPSIMLNLPADLLWKQWLSYVQLFRSFCCSEQGNIHSLVFSFRFLLINILISTSITDPFLAGREHTGGEKRGRELEIMLWCHLHVFCGYQSSAWRNLGRGELAISHLPASAPVSVWSSVLPCRYDPLWHGEGDNEWLFYCAKPAQLAVSMCSFRNALIAAWGQVRGGQPGSLRSAL